ncbi:hypothetical protein [Prochlorococcus marinus]|uniref:hypothetical protein n=1 Tax=Prochlorococcus marinus TaxID=1219 RepID=UPI0022B2BCC7|nr:hypothetical protein [Prochlorococcus marinus]
MEINKNDFQINIAALTDHVFTPSSRFRIRQLIDGLQERSINVIDLPRRFSSELSGKYFPNRRIRNSKRKLLSAINLELKNISDTYSRILTAREYDFTWISRELIIGYPSFEWLLKKPIIYDIDDAIFIRNRFLRKGIEFLAKEASYVCAENQYLYDYCKQFNNNVTIIPPSVDTKKFKPKAKRELESKEFIIGWSGTSSSYPYLLEIEDNLYRFFSNNRNCKLQICSDKEPKELTKISDYIQYKRWNPSDEVSQIQGFDVGIMPLIDNEWIKGKSAFKQLLYMSCGIPVIATNLAVNKELFSYGSIGIPCESGKDWEEALSYMHKNKQVLGTQFGEGRNIILEKYSLESICTKLSKLFIKLKNE